MARPAAQDEAAEGLSVSETDDEAAALKLELLRMDVQLRHRQLWWEHPRNAAIVLGVVIALVGTAAGIVGYKIGREPPAPIVIQLQQPATR